MSYHKTRPFYFLEVNNSVLLPAGRQDTLHLLRLLIDRLIPRKAGLLTERGHGLNQLIDLCAE